MTRIEVRRYVRVSLDRIYKIDRMGTAFIS